MGSEQFRPRQAVARDFRAALADTGRWGARLQDPAGLFNSSPDGNVRRATDIHEGDRIDEGALQALVRAAVALNTSAPASGRRVRAQKRPKGT